MPGAIDIVINLHTPEVLAFRPGWYRDFLGGKIGADSEIINGFPIEKYLERMDRAGIQMVFITAAKSGSKGHPSNWHLPYEMVADVVKKHPTRFKGLAGLDPTEGMKGVRKLEYAIKELGFLGAYLYPVWRREITIGCLCRRSEKSPAPLAPRSRSHSRRERLKSIHRAK
jgi:predicted TIM-barrel fold metal-dependent hydrolase